MLRHCKKCNAALVIGVNCTQNRANLSDYRCQPCEAARLKEASLNWTDEQKQRRRELTNRSNALRSAKHRDEVSKRPLEDVSRYANRGKTKQSVDHVAKRWAKLRITLENNPANCQYCKKLFVRSIGNQRYCSDYCRGKLRRQREAVKLARPHARIEVSGALYKAAIAQFGAACNVCGSVEPGNGRSDRMVVDHCHATGRIRGVLCNPCNTALGLFKDNPDRIRRAAAYLQRDLLAKYQPKLAA